MKTDVGQSADSALGFVEHSTDAAVLFHPLRRRILEVLREPDSASGLSRRLELPRQRLNYHLRELEKASLVELVEERRRGNCVERIFRATARSYVIDPATLGGLAADPDQVKDRLSSTFLMALASSVIRDLGTLRKKAAKAGQRLATLSLQTEVRFATAARRKAFFEELAGEVARLAAKYHDEGAEDGRRFRLFLAGYPAVKRKQEKEKKEGEGS